MIRDYDNASYHPAKSDSSYLESYVGRITLNLIIDIKKLNLNDCTPKFTTLIIGCGNLLRGDDGVGPILIRRLWEIDRLPPHIRLADGGTGGMDVNTVPTSSLGQNAAAIGRAVKQHPGILVARTGIGGTRVVDMQIGEQLPRIC